MPHSQIDLPDRQEPPELFAQLLGLDDVAVGHPRLPSQRADSEVAPVRQRQPLRSESPRAIRATDRRAHRFSGSGRDHQAYRQPARPRSSTSGRTLRRGGIGLSSPPATGHREYGMQCRRPRRLATDLGLVLELAAVPAVEALVGLDRRDAAVVAGIGIAPGGGVARGRTPAPDTGRGWRARRPRDRATCRPRCPGKRRAGCRPRSRQARCYPCPPARRATRRHRRRQRAHGLFGAVVRARAPHEGKRDQGAHENTGQRRHDHSSAR